MSQEKNAKTRNIKLLSRSSKSFKKKGGKTVIADADACPSTQDCPADCPISSDSDPTLHAATIGGNYVEGGASPELDAEPEPEPEPERSVVSHEPELIPAGVSFVDTSPHPNLATGLDAEPQPAGAAPALYDPSYDIDPAVRRAREEAAHDMMVMERGRAAPSPSYRIEPSIDRKVRSGLEEAAAADMMVLDRARAPTAGGDAAAAATAPKPERDPPALHDPILGDGSEHARAR